MNYTFISGATGGIGKAFVYECAKKGYALFLTGRSLDKLTALKAEVQQKYAVEIEVFACMLNDETSRKEMFDYIAQKDFKFDRIINVAGVDTQMAVECYTLDKLIFQMRVNVEGTITNTYSLLKHRADKVEVITVSSMSGVTPMPYFALYSATKGCLTSFFSSLRLEMKKQNVKITTVLPGGVPTRPDIVADIKGQGLWGKLSAKQPSFVAEKSLKKVKKNKRIYIPGFFNRFLYRLMKILPLGVKMRFIARRWKKIKKDAF